MADIIVTRGAFAARFDSSISRRAVAEYIGGEGAILEHSEGDVWTLYPGDPESDSAEYTIRGAEAWR